MKSKALSFPKNFKWCVATAGHQIEGGNFSSDWWWWENQPGKIKHGDTSRVACDHWNRVESDSDLIRDMGFTDYRMSVEWAKIEPEPGVFKDDVLRHYKNEVRALRQRGISPMVTLNHFVLPKWFLDMGGWAHPNAPKMFERYARQIYAALGSDVDFWFTLNEPMVYVTLAYVTNMFPPGANDVKLAPPVVKGLLLSHARAYRALHDLAARFKRRVYVGIAHHLRIFDPLRPNDTMDVWIARLLEKTFNWTMIDALQTGRLTMKIPLVLDYEEDLPELRGTEDFVGINYYSRDIIRFSLRSPLFFERLIRSEAPVSDVQWEIYPEGLYRLLKELHARYKDTPLLISENGIADRNHQKRKHFIQTHLEQTLRAMNEGVPVIGYCHWTLMDNFEWIEGYEPKFGLFETHYETQERRLRPSGEWFKAFIHSQ